MMDYTPHFPLFLELEGRRVVVVGGGAVGARKARELLAAHADVVVVDPHPGSDIVRFAEEGRVVLRRRAFEVEDLEGAWLTIAATEERATNAAVAEAASARRIFCNAVDDPPNSSAYFASTVRRPPLTIAISSNGEAPALARLLRELIEQILPEQEWVARAKELRARWRAEKTPMRSRFGELVRTIAARTS